MRLGAPEHSGAPVQPSTEHDVSDYKKPIPQPSVETQRYWEGTPVTS